MKCVKKFLWIHYLFFFFFKLTHFVDYSKLFASKRTLDTLAYQLYILITLHYKCFKQERKISSLNDNWYQLHSYNYLRILIYLYNNSEKMYITKHI